MTKKDTKQKCEMCGKWADFINHETKIKTDGLHREIVDICSTCVPKLQKDNQKYRI